MLTIQIGKTNKRINSTAIPSNNYWITSSHKFENCTFKEGTSFETPTVQIYTATDLSECNYMTIWRNNSNVKKYYWITDIRQINNVWEITGVKDNLAQYRTEIGALTPQVLRCGANWNRDIMDDKATFSHVQNRTNTKDAPFNLSIEKDQKFVVLNIAGIKFTSTIKDSPNKVKESDVQETNFICFPLKYLQLFLSVIENQVTSANATCDWSLSNNLLGAYVTTLNPAYDLSGQTANIIQAWIEGTPSAERVNAGDLMEKLADAYNNEVEMPHTIVIPRNFQFYAITTTFPTTSRGESWDFPTHPQFSTTNYNWLNRGDGIESINIYWGPMGGLSIPVDKLAGSKIHMLLVFDWKNNTAVVTARSDTQAIGQAQITPFFPGLQVSNLIEKTKESKWANEDRVYNNIRSGVSGVASVLSLNPVGTANSVLSIRDNIVNADRTISTKAEVTGVNSSYAGWALSIKFGMQLQTLFKLYQIPDIHLFGRPVYAKRLISACGSDLIVCGTVEISGLGGAMPDEIADIVSCMQGGFYFE